MCQMPCPMLFNNATQFIVIYDQNQRKWINFMAEDQEIILDMISRERIINILQVDKRHQKRFGRTE